MARHANYSPLGKPLISITTYKNDEMSTSEACHNGSFSAKLLLQPRPSPESYFAVKLGVNLKTTHVKSIEENVSGEK